MIKFARSLAVPDADSGGRHPTDEFARGDSALRMARLMPLEARLYSVELNGTNAEIARGLLTYAGVDDRGTVVGTLGDGGETIRTLKRGNGLTQGSLDLAFID